MRVQTHMETLRTFLRMARLTTFSGESRTESPVLFLMENSTGEVAEGTLGIIGRETGSPGPCLRTRLLERKCPPEVFPRFTPLLCHRGTERAEQKPALSPLPGSRPLGIISGATPISPSLRVAWPRAPKSPRRRSVSRGAEAGVQKV